LRRDGPIKQSGAGLGSLNTVVRLVGWLRGIGSWRAGFWQCASCGGGSAGQVLHSQGSLGRWGYRADALEGKVATIQCSFRPCPAAAPFFWGVRQRAFAERGMGWVCVGTGCWGMGIGVVCYLVVAPRDRSCTRRDRSGGGAIALTRWKERLLRSSARFGPVPLPHHYFWGVGQRAFAERGLGGIRCL
jgi:hypothetical protein